VRILVLGAGFGGLELTARLSADFGDAIEIVLIDRNDSFVFGFSKLDVMFGRTDASWARHRYSEIVKPGVRFVQTTVRSIDPAAKRVETDAGPFEGDVMVIGLGADLDIAATPGLAEAGHEFYTVGGAFAARDVLAGFDGGDVIIGVLSTPFKCPPAPSEAALLLHDQLVDRGLRDRSTISLVIDFRRPIPPSAKASALLLTAFEERGIAWHPRSEVCELDPQRKVATLRDGAELPFDLFLGVPVHRRWSPSASPRGSAARSRRPSIAGAGSVTSSWGTTRSRSSTSRSSPSSARASCGGRRRRSSPTRSSSGQAASSAGSIGSGRRLGYESSHG
jgi:sulfide:quinone oxidoreductase